jgi:hypothetical protein
MDWLPLVSLGLAAAVQLGAIAFWGGRISARLEALDHRLQQLERHWPRAA